MNRKEALNAYLESQRLRKKNPLAPRGLLIGQAAPKTAKGHASAHALFPHPKTSAGYRLFAMSKWDIQDWFVHWDRINTIAEFPGRGDGKGDAFPVKEARRRADENIDRYDMRSRVCLFVGKSNAKAYDWRDWPPPFEITETPEGGHWAWVPHTSGIVQSWNKAENRGRLQSTLSRMRDLLGVDLSPLDP